MTIPAFPLAWPAGWKRTPTHQRKTAQFRGNRRRLTIYEALERVRSELARMGVSDNDLVISTNVALRLDGFPRSDQSEPSDRGVAVYWRGRRDGDQPPKCMAIDCYDRVADNLAAVAATLDALRAIERHGGAMILDRAFAGFTALPGPEAIDWRDVLDAVDPEGSYRRLRSKHHPDNGGDADQFQRVQRAWDSYQADRGR